MQNVHTHSFHGMGSNIQLWLQHPKAEVAQKILAEAEEMFVRHEAIMTRFDPHSELSQLNAQPEQWVQLSNILWEVINRSIQFAYQLDGLFDPTVIDVLEQIGYERSFVADSSFEQEANRVSTKVLDAYTAVQINPILQSRLAAPRGSFRPWRHRQRVYRRDCCQFYARLGTLSRGCGW